MHFSHNLKRQWKEYSENPHIVHSWLLTQQPLGDQLSQAHVCSPGVLLVDNSNISKQATDAEGNALFTWVFPL